MPNGGDLSDEEFELLNEPMIRVDPVLERFGDSIGARLIHNYHASPNRQIRAALRDAIVGEIHLAVGWPDAGRAGARRGREICAQRRRLSRHSRPETVLDGEDCRILRKPARRGRHHAAAARGVGATEPGGPAVPAIAWSGSAPPFPPAVTGAIGREQSDCSTARPAALLTGAPLTGTFICSAPRERMRRFFGTGFHRCRAARGRLR